MRDTYEDLYNSLRRTPFRQMIKVMDPWLTYEEREKILLDNGWNDRAWRDALTKDLQQLMRGSESEASRGKDPSHRVSE